MKQRLVLALAIATTLALGGAPARADGDPLAALRGEFQAYSGAELVFTAGELPRATYYEIMPELDHARAIEAATIAVREVKKYPPGYLGDIGLRAIGVFAGLASKKGDGFRPWNKQLGGYRYFGLWNGASALVAAYYTDEQLPLTLHHEIFHHVDGTAGGRTDFASAFTDDDQAFSDAIDGSHRYPAPAIAAADLAALARRGHGWELRDAVSDYAAKNPGEDQAETARYLMTALPDALVQVVRHPAWAGSQRMLHVLAQYGHALDGEPALGWFVDVALDRADRRGFAAAADRTVGAMRKRIQPAGDLVVWGGEDAAGINWTLRADLRRFGDDARALARAPGRSDDTLTRAELRMLQLLARYQQFIAGRWMVSPGTQQSFDWARAQMTAALPGTAAALRQRLERAGWERLARDITADGRVTGALERAPAPPRDNPYLAVVDAAISDPVIRRAIRAVQPAAIRLDNGSGFLVTGDGVILTAAHVVGHDGARKNVTLPDGRHFTATTFAIDKRLDVAALRIDGGVSGLPVTPLAPAAPKVGDTAICIGQPGRYTPDGEETGYQPFHVSVGRIRGFLPDPLGPQALGRTKHDAWTYWGHSGSPIYDARGRIIAMHNSWDSTTAMRHAVTWEALIHFLAEHRISYTTLR